MAELTAVIGADTSKLTKSLNDAKRVLNDYANKTKEASSEISKTTGVNNAQVASFQRVVKVLEQVNSGSMETSKAQKALSRQVQELKIQWANLSDTAKSSDFGKAISDSLKTAESQLKEFNAQVKKAKEEVKELEKGGGTDIGFGDLSSAFNSIKSGDIKGITESLNKLKSVDLSSVSKGLLGIGTSAETAGASVGAGFTAALGPIAAVAAAIAGVAYAIKASSDFEVHLDSLQSLTGLADDAMKDISDGALEMSNKFSTSAGDIVDAMGLIGSQAPALLKDKDALMQVTDAANTLAKAAGIGVTDAAKGITTAMNQMGIDASSATDIINLLAAASQQGSASVEYLNTAIEKSAAQAASSGMSYSQLVSTLEGVAPLFSSADVAGSQLNSTLLALATSSNDQFKPSVVGLNQALENLAKAEMDDAKMKELVGASNITMLKALINNKDAIVSYEDSLVGTNTAEEQMKTNMDNLNTSISGICTQFENFFIALGNTQPIQNLISDIMAIISTLGDVIGMITDVMSAFDEFENVPGTISPIQITLEALKRNLEIVATVCEVVVRLIAKAWNWVSGVIIDAWNACINVVKDTGWYKTLKAAWDKCVEWFENMVNQLKDLWDKFKKWLGMDVTTGKITVDKSGKGIEDISTGGGSSGSGSGGKSGGKSGSSNTTPKAAAGSLSDLESKLSDLQKKYKDGLIKITPEDYKAQVESLEKSIQDKKIELGLVTKVDDGSLKALEDEISKKQAELKLAVGQESRNKIQAEINALTDKKNTIEFDLKFDETKIDKLIQTKEKPKAKVSDEFKTSDVRADGAAGETIKSNNEKITANNAELDRLASVLENLQAEYDKLGESIAKASALDIDTSKETEAYNKLSEAISETADEMEKLKDANKGIIKDNKKVEKGVKKTEKQMQALGATSDTISSMGSAFGSLGDAIGGTEGQVLSMIGTTMGGIAELIPQIVALIGAKEGEAIASGTASASQAPWFMVIPQIAAVVATVTGIFASLAGSFANGGIIPKYADGGMIGGATKIGDYNIARVNAGEMILNGTQQAKLFSMLNTSGTTLQSVPNGNVKFKIEGNALVGVLKNYSSKINKL